MTMCVMIVECECDRSIRALLASLSHPHVGARAMGTADVWLKDHTHSHWDPGPRDREDTANYFAHVPSI